MNCLGMEVIYFLITTRCIIDISFYHKGTQRETRKDTKERQRDFGNLSMNQRDIKDDIDLCVTL